MQWQMIELPAFMRVRDSIFADDFDFAEFQQMLASNPLAGNEIQGTGGLRKVRWRSRKSGKEKAAAAARFIWSALFRPNQIEE